MLRRRHLLVAAVVGAALLPAPADAALIVRLAVVPGAPAVGDRVTIVVRPFWPLSTGSRRAKVDAEYPFRIEAVSQRGAVAGIHVRRSRNPFVWTGRFTFAQPGLWLLRAANWGPRYEPHPRHRPQLRLVVARAERR